MQTNKPEASYASPPGVKQILDKFSNFALFSCPNPSTSAENLRESVALSSHRATGAQVRQDHIHGWVNGWAASLAAIELTEKKSQVCWDAGENPRRGILSLLPARLRITERDHSEPMLASPAFSPQEKKKTRERGDRLFSNPICTCSAPMPLSTSETRFSLRQRSPYVY